MGTETSVCRHWILLLLNQCEVRLNIMSGSWEKKVTHLVAAMTQRNRNRQGQYSLQENAPSGMFSPTRPSSHYLPIMASTLGIH